MSFASGTRQEKIGALQLNKHINIRLKCESLDDVGVLDEAVFNENIKQLQKGYWK